MERPELPPVVPGRSALPAFLEVERRVRSALAAEEAAAQRTVDDAEAEATRVRREGEARLKQVVLDAEQAAMRESEARERDRVSEQRVRVQQWIEQAERAAEASVAAAVELLVRDGRAEA